MTKKVNKKYTVITSICLILTFCVIGCVTLISNIQSIKTKDAIYEYRFSRNPGQTRTYHPTAEQDSLYRIRQEQDCLIKYNELIKK